VLKAYPFCCRCSVALSELVDHVVPAGVAIKQAKDSGLWPLDPYAGFYFESNLQGLCRACHWIKTLADKMHVGPWPDTVSKEKAKAPKRWRF
jgi:hypothetical protein